MNCLESENNMYLRFACDPEAEASGSQTNLKDMCHEHGAFKLS